MSPRKPQWEITLEGPFSSAKTVKSDEVIFKYSGKHRFNPKKINYYSQYTFLGKTSPDTIEVELREGGAILDEEKAERTSIRIYERRVFNRFPLKTPSLYTKCTKKDVVLLEIIEVEEDALEGAKLSYHIILPDCLDEVIRRRRQEQESEENNSEDDSFKW
jgi:hypothetical protein